MVHQDRCNHDRVPASALSRVASFDMIGAFAFGPVIFAAGPGGRHPRRPSEFSLRELPPLRAILDDLSELGLSYQHVSRWTIRHAQNVTFWITPSARFPHRGILRTIRVELQVPLLPQVTVDANMLAGRLRLTLRAAARRS
jgi:hypothetical protein